MSDGFEIVIPTNLTASITKQMNKEIHKPNYYNTEPMSENRGKNFSFGWKDFFP